MKKVSLLYVVGLFAAAIGAGAALCQPYPVGPEFRVNDWTLDSQGPPAVAMAPWGDSVITWLSGGLFCPWTVCTSTWPGPGDSWWGIYAQRYDASGTPMPGCSQFKVNTWVFNTIRDQWFPAIGMDYAGDFLIAWTSYQQDGSSYGVYAQCYGDPCAAIGPEFRVNTYTDSIQIRPAVAVRPGGDSSVVAWSSRYQDGSEYGIYAQRYGSCGVPAGPEFPVNQYTSGHQHGASVAMDPWGNFVIAWGSQQDGSGYGIYARQYNASGVPLGDEFLVNQYTTDWQHGASVAMDDSGNFVIAWHSEGQDGSGRGIYARRYDSSANSLGDEFQVNSYTAGSQEYTSAAMDCYGNFVIVWMGADDQDGSGYGIFGQCFDPDGNPLGGEFQANTYTLGDQMHPSVAMDCQGSFVVAWTSFGQDGDSWGVYAQRYALRPAVLTVAIDIKPGSYPNAINLGSHGVIPVAILSSDTFDATQVDAGTVALAGAGVAVRGKAANYLAHEEDVNGDGLLDLVIQVETENLDPGEFQDGYACLTGTTHEGESFEGCDDITVVPPG